MGAHARRYRTCTSHSGCAFLFLFLTFAWPHALQVTQLGHVKDLATAFVKILGNPRAARQVYNISGER